MVSLLPINIVLDLPVVLPLKKQTRVRSSDDVYGCVRILVPVLELELSELSELLLANERLELSAS